MPEIESSQDSEKTESVEKPAPNGSGDPFSFYNQEHVSPDQRETWNKGWDGLKSKMAEYEKELASSKEAAEAYGHFSGVPGFERFANTPPEVTFDTLVDAYEELSKQKSTTAQTATSSSPKTAPSPGIDPSEWDDFRNTVKEFKAQQLEVRAHQDVARLLNTRPEAKELLKDKEVRDQILQLTEGDNPLPLDAAYAVATRDKYADWKIRSATEEKNKAPKVESGTSPSPAPKRDRHETLDETLERNFSRVAGLSD